MLMFVGLFVTTMQKIFKVKVGYQSRYLKHQYSINSLPSSLTHFIVAIKKKMHSNCVQKIQQKLADSAGINLKGKINYKSKAPKIQ